MAKTFKGIRPADPGRYIRGEQPWPYAQCKREIRGHVDAVLAWAKLGGSQTPRDPAGQVIARRKQQAAEDVMAMALETISCERLNERGKPDADALQGWADRRQDLLLARYALKQARRLSA